MMAPYLPVSTSESMLLMMPSRTTFWISSNSPYNVFIKVNTVPVTIVAQHKPMDAKFNVLIV